MYKADWNTFYRTPAMHALMTSKGDGAKRIWGTEVGYPTGTNPRAVSTSKQSDVRHRRGQAVDELELPRSALPVLDPRLQHQPVVLDGNMGLLYGSGARNPPTRRSKKLLRPLACRKRPGSGSQLVEAPGLVAGPS